MKLAVGSDHAGFRLKVDLVKKLSKEFKVIDFGTFSEESCDYPDYAVKVVNAVLNKEADCGILICATGEGMAIVANKFKGIRAGVCYSDDVAKLLSEHNFANVICFPSRIRLNNNEEITADLLYRWTKIWIESRNSVEERHKRRIKKIIAIEEANFK
ncbi:MAG: RpiB/LacA/LacB family sugar-phosphate isomerase [Endomicrobia bacterium]|nr:RpiB/LacA/LacB family sugar-phosphate isomerase [Endomicrobiia bacterium]